MNTELLSMLSGLAAAASWGAGDFSGGLATRRSSVLRVVLVSQLVGGLLLLLLALAFAETFPAVDHLWFGALAGICGAIGLLSLYHSLATRPMGLVAPLTAVLAALLPVGVGISGEGWPPPLQILGFGLALLAVWLLSGGGSGQSIAWRELGLPLLAGLGFGLFFILIDRVSSQAILWPLVAARVGSLSFVALVAGLRRRAVSSGRMPWAIIALAGIFDAGGNAFFALASGLGRLDIATVLSSLYPAGTVLLAWLVLQERLARAQLLGVLCALGALALIAV